VQVASFWELGRPSPSHPDTISSSPSNDNGFQATLADYFQELGGLCTKYLSLNSQIVEFPPAIEEHTLLSIAALSQLKTLRLPPMSEKLLTELLPRLALLPKLEYLYYLGHDLTYHQLERATPRVGFPAFRSRHWTHSVTLLPYLFQSIQSPQFSSLHIAQRTVTVSSVLRDVLQSLAKLHGSTLASFTYHIRSLSFDDVNALQYCITLDTLQPLARLPRPHYTWS
jgi:hypothetical protein